MKYELMIKGRDNLPITQGDYDSFLSIKKLVPPDSFLHFSESGHLVREKELDGVVVFKE